MKHLLCAFLLLCAQFSFSQSSKIKPTKYPSLLWEIRGPGLQKPSYLFGTMHVSSKMVFNLSDSFYLGIKNAQVVALETNPGTWQEDFSRYDMDGESLQELYRYRYASQGYGAPQDYLTVNTLKLSSYEKMMEALLYSNPSVINNFLYRSRSEFSADFEEDTYLDLHIFQAGRKLGKRICGVEDFHGSMQLVKEAYTDAAKEKNKKERSYDTDEDLSYRKLEEAYRTGNLDLLDTINKVNSQSAAFDEKFLYRRNEIQAHSIDSILKRGQTLFVGVGAAHLPGQRGVIELLRRAGYTLRPVKMRERDSREKDLIEKIRVPVQFTKQTAEDGFYSVSVPGRLYSFGASAGGADMHQYADMTNGSYYMVSRLFTNAAILGQSEAQVERKVDSVLYENIPGKIITKRPIVKNGYRGFEVINRTRRGDYQRYNIFVTPFEIIIFKMSGNGDYVRLGTEATQFFSSIQLSDAAAKGWRKYKPAFGGFEVEMPHEPMFFKTDNRQWAAYDAASKTAFEVVRTDVQNHSFLEEDSFDLNLMEESFASSEFIQRQLSRTNLTANGYPALDARYKFKDSSVAQVRFLIQGPHYYTLIAKAEAENKTMPQFIHSFGIKPFVYGEAMKETDTALQYSVKTPVPLQKKKKLSMYPDAGLYNDWQNNDDDSLLDRGKYLDKVIEAENTGEKIYVRFHKPSAYFYNSFTPEKESKEDSADYAKDWTVRLKKIDTLADKSVVAETELGYPGSSRLLKTKSILRNGLGYQLQTELDTLSTRSAFINSFFQSFAPIDTVKGIDVKTKKTALFFSQFFSPDTVLHKTAVKNLSTVAMDSSDFLPLKKAIESLNWKEKKYLDVKKDAIGKLADMPTKEASDYLKAIYAAANDTVELQYAALETLLQQGTAYSYKTFAGIMEADPPVLDGAVSTYGNSNSFMRRYLSSNDFLPSRFARSNFRSHSDGSFLDNLSDTLKLTAGIYKNLLPLINLEDYKEPLMELTAGLLDSNLVAAKDYETYVPKLLIEAKQLLKKQVIGEKSKAIEKAQEDESENTLYSRYGRDQADNGNTTLSLYAKLLVPFWDKNPQVPALLQRMMQSEDKRLKYNTALLLLQNKKPLPDTLLAYFADMDEYRYELYSDLKKQQKLSLFPAVYKTQEAIARSRVLEEQSYNKPDTVAFLQKLPLAYKGREGFVYIFKYKDNKADNSWKLASVGLLPKDSALYSFDEKGEAKEDDEDDYDFTDLSSTKLTTDAPVNEQVQKLMKKLLYSKRKSAAQFYAEEGRYGDFDFSRMR